MLGIYEAVAHGTGSMKQDATKTWVKGLVNVAGMKQKGRRMHTVGDWAQYGRVRYEPKKGGEG